ncbi:MAG: AAA family ATPase [Pirellula sp.]|jgi:predicted kinase
MKWEQLKNKSIDEIAAWAETQGWCQAMADCVQDAEWHSEGDVWTHTRLVLVQLTELMEWNDLSKHDQTVLTFTALFHDVAKPLTTEIDPETGRVRSPNHAVKGELVARNVLRGLGCDLITREQISRLVRYHGRPAFLSERAEPVHEVVRLSWLVNNQLLYLFAVADTRGRDTDAMDRPEENLHYWRMQAEELGCLDQPYVFHSDHARFMFLRRQSSNLYYIPHEDFSCTVTLVSGLPGSGKDTWLCKNKPHLPVVSLDDIRSDLEIDPTDNQGQVAQEAKRRCKEFLRSGRSFAFNATNTTRQIRNRWVDLFAAYHARIEIVYLEPPMKTILAQNGQRLDSVPASIIRKLADKCEPPTWSECHNLIIEEGGDS